MVVLEAAEGEAYVVGGGDATAVFVAAESAAGEAGVEEEDAGGVVVIGEGAVFNSDV